MRRRLWRNTAAAGLLAAVGGWAVMSSSAATPSENGRHDATPTPLAGRVLFGGNRFRTARVLKATSWTESGQQLPLLADDYTGLTVTLYDDRSATARTGCGGLSGSWAVRDGRLDLVDVQRSRNLSEDSCGEARKREDDKSAGFLMSSPTYMTDGSKVVLSNGPVTVVFAMGPSPTPRSWSRWALLTTEADGQMVPGVRAHIGLEFFSDLSMRWRYGPCVVGSSAVSEVGERAIRLVASGASADCSYERFEPLDRVLSAEQVEWTFEDPTVLVLTAGGVVLRFLEVP